MVQVTPLYNAEEIESSSIASLAKSKQKQGEQFAISFKFCLIVTITFLVALSVIILTGIWLASITSTSLQMTNIIIQDEFFKIQQFCNQLIDEVYLSSNTATGQLQVAFNSSSFDHKALSTYNMYRSEVESGHKDTCVCLFVADSYETLVGIYLFQGKVNQFTAVKDVDLKMWQCDDVENQPFCTNKKTPDIITPPFDNHRPVAACNATPNGTFFLPSFADPNYVDDMFLTLVKCFSHDSFTQASDNNLKFQYLFAYQLSSNSLSTFLVAETSATPSVVSLVVELDTGYIVATNKQNVGLSSLDSKGNVIRKGLLDLTNADQQEVASYISKKYNGDFISAMTCDTSVHLTSANRYISLYRMCNGVDWLLVYSIPIFNYSGSLIIAVVCAVIGGLIIMIFSAVMGVLLSVKIVSPFKDLITLFDSVSNMDLDSIDIKQSSFQEVQQLQYHFLSMVKQIKLYRSFLPAHLLAQLDNEDKPGDRDGKETNKKDEEYKSSHKSFFSQSSNNNNSSTMMKHINRFDLYLEQKHSTAVALLIDGLSDCFTKHSKSEKEILHILKDIFEIVVSTSTQFNAQRGNLENDIIIISFNTSNTIKQHEFKAVECAYTLRKKFDRLLEKWKSSENSFFGEHLNFNLAVCTDNSYCGNVGTKEFKNFTIISPLKSHLKSLFAHSKLLNVKIIVSDVIYTQVSSKFEMRCVGKVAWLTGNKEFSFFPVEEGITQSISVYELGESLEVKMDEWLYELEQRERANRWKLYSYAYELFEHNQYTEAKQYWEEFLEKNSQDVPSLHFLSECEQLISI